MDKVVFAPNHGYSNRLHSKQWFLCSASVGKLVLEPCLMQSMRDCDTINQCRHSALVFVSRDENLLTRQLACTNSSLLPKQKAIFSTLQERFQKTRPTDDEKECKWRKQMHHSLQQDIICYSRVLPMDGNPVWRHHTRLCTGMAKSIFYRTSPY